jgi:hypothetical protein
MKQLPSVYSAGDRVLLVKLLMQNMKVVFGMQFAYKGFEISLLILYSKKVTIHTIICGRISLLMVQLNEISCSSFDFGLATNASLPAPSCGVALTARSDL